MEGVCAVFELGWNHFEKRERERERARTGGLGKKICLFSSFPTGDLRRHVRRERERERESKRRKIVSCGMDKQWARNVVASLEEKEGKRRRRKRDSLPTPPAFSYPPPSRISLSLFGAHGIPSP